MDISSRHSYWKAVTSHSWGEKGSKRVWDIKSSSQATRVHLSSCTTVSGTKGFGERWCNWVAYSILVTTYTLRRPTRAKSTGVALPEIMEALLGQLPLHSKGLAIGLDQWDQSRESTTGLLVTHQHSPWNRSCQCTVCAADQAPRLYVTGLVLCNTNPHGNALGGRPIALLTTELFLF